MSKTVAERVLALIAEPFDDDVAVRPETTLVDDLGLDSLDLVELVMSIEDEFAVIVDDEEAMSCVTVADCIALVERLQQQPEDTATLPMFPAA